ncbi:hypothetical protein, partial [Actinoplanes sp. ATCC 53533]|uniref:hypothetical protein n=1 Tax=Actinoplanes sp. ATCC 53533 TaxID=1288362 RepID=UPI0011D0616F
MPAAIRACRSASPVLPRTAERAGPYQGGLEGRQRRVDPVQQRLRLGEQLQRRGAAGRVQGGQRRAGD